jgi:hypothetical protein
MATLWTQPTKPETNIEFDIGDKKIACHKEILAARSSKMNAMLSSGLKETFASVIQADASYTAFSLLLEYLYTDNIQVEALEASLPPQELVNSIVELTSLADEHLLPPLGNICADFLKKYLDDSNSEQMEELANATRNQRLQSHVYYFNLSKK